jgi:hypothetical protein
MRLAPDPRQRQAILNRAAVLVAPEKPDEQGAITALLVMVAVSHLRLLPDNPEVSRLKAIATRVLAEHGDEITNAASALRMCDQMLELAVEDYKRIQGGSPDGPIGSRPQ